MNHLGDYDLSAVIYGMFNTFDPATGGLVTLSGSGASLVVFKNNGSGESSAGITLTLDFDSRTGCHAFNIDTSADGTFYSAGGAFSVIVNGGMAGAVSLAGAVIASFSLRKDSSLKPTTAGRTLDVSAGGEAGLDWANIGSPTTANNLSATNIDVDQVVASVSGAVGSVTGAVGSVTGAVGSVTGNVGGNVVGSVASVTGNVGGNVTGSVGSIAAGGLTAASTAADFVTEVQSAAAAALTAYDPPTEAQMNARTLVAADYATATALAAVNTLATGIDLVTDKLDGMVTLGSGSSSYQYTQLALALAPSGGGSLTVQQIVDGVWDEPMANHLDSGTTGASLNGAGSAGDPWGTALPGAYGAGTAGNIVGNNLNATVSSRASQTSVDDVPTVAEFNARTLVAAGYATATAVDDLPTVAEFNARTLAAASYATATAVDDLPTNAELAARTLLAASYATAAALAVTDGKVDTVDTVVDGIAAKTVQLTFGATNTLNANITHVIADPIQENGSTATNWGGTP